MTLRDGGCHHAHGKAAKAGLPVAGTSREPSKLHGPSASIPEHTTSQAAGQPLNVMSLPVSNSNSPSSTEAGSGGYLQLRTHTRTHMKIYQ